MSPQIVNAEVIPYQRNQNQFTMPELASTAAGLFGTISQINQNKKAHELAQSQSAATTMAKLAEMGIPQEQASAVLGTLFPGVKGLTGVTTPGWAAYQNEKQLRDQGAPTGETTPPPPTGTPGAPQTPAQPAAPPVDMEQAPEQAKQTMLQTPPDHSVLLDALNAKKAQGAVPEAPAQPFDPAAAKTQATQDSLAGTPPAASSSPSPEEVANLHFTNTQIAQNTPAAAQAGIDPNAMTTEGVKGSMGQPNDYAFQVAKASYMTRLAHAVQYGGTPPDPTHLSNLEMMGPEARTQYFANAAKAEGLDPLTANTAMMHLIHSSNGTEMPGDAAKWDALSDDEKRVGLTYAQNHYPDIYKDSLQASTHKAQLTSNETIHANELQYQYKALQANTDEATRRQTEMERHNKAGEVISGEEVQLRTQQLQQQHEVMLANIQKSTRGQDQQLLTGMLGKSEQELSNASAQRERAYKDLFINLPRADAAQTAAVGKLGQAVAGMRNVQARLQGLAQSQSYLSATPADQATMRAGLAQEQAQIQTEIDAQKKFFPAGTNMDAVMEGSRALKEAQDRYVQASANHTQSVQYINTFLQQTLGGRAGTTTDTPAAALTPQQTAGIPAIVGQYASPQAYLDARPQLTAKLPPAAQQAADQAAKAKWPDIKLPTTQTEVGPPVLPPPPAPPSGGESTAPPPPATLKKAPAAPAPLGQVGTRGTPIPAPSLPAQKAGPPSAPAAPAGPDLSTPAGVMDYLRSGTDQVHSDLTAFQKLRAAGYERMSPLAISRMGITDPAQIGRLNGLLASPPTDAQVRSAAMHPLIEPYMPTKPEALQRVASGIMAAHNNTKPIDWGDFQSTVRAQIVKDHPGLSRADVAAEVANRLPAVQQAFEGQLAQYYGSDKKTPDERIADLAQKLLDNNAIRNPLMNPQAVDLRVPAAYKGNLGAFLTHHGYSAADVAEAIKEAVRSQKLK